jgi:alpha-galactosidase
MSAELAQKDAWIKQNFLVEQGPLPFSFTYGGQSSGELLPSWERKATTAKLDAQRTEHTLTWTDPRSGPNGLQTGLAVRCVAVDYADFPVVEWTLYFKNTGTVATPILAAIQAIDAALPGNADGHGILRWFAGSLAIMEDFQPRTAALLPGAAHHFQPVGGRPSNGTWPYFNLDFGEQGIVAAIGWPGQWAARIEGVAGGAHLRSGQARTHLVLEPGEEIRSPLIALLFWHGDWIAGQNVWRRWMISHNLPRLNGKLPEPFTAVCVDDAFPGMLSNAADVIGQMDLYHRNGMRYDYWWTDAGWYPAWPDWVNTGTWEPDPERYPKGLKEITDHSHQLGMKHVVWFEPERVTPGSWLYENRPQWLLSREGAHGGWKLFNMGDPEAWRWLVEHVDELIVTQGIDLYRQDFNFDPLLFWAAADKSDRVGMTENKYVVGHLAYWDELRRRHPGMLIDSCASGGRRLDLESVRRGVANTRTDYRFEPIGTQGQHYGISFWLPFTGSGVYQDTPYVMRSHMNTQFGCGVNFLRQLPDWELLKRMDAEWRKIVTDQFLGDYYPLTEYSLSKDAWMAWQFHRPETGTGYVQAFRRDNCVEASKTFRLRGLDAGARYGVTNFDIEGTTAVSGRELMETGLTVEMKDKPGAAVIVYKPLR